MVRYTTGSPTWKKPSMAWIHSTKRGVGSTRNRKWRRTMTSIDQWKSIAASHSVPAPK